jgi:hypothetical protein
VFELRLFDFVVLVASIDLVESNAYLNGSIKRKRPDTDETTAKMASKDETKKTISKEERVRTIDEKQIEQFN